jgi:hypothetical protein
VGNDTARWAALRHGATLIELERYARIVEHAISRPAACGCWCVTSGNTSVAGAPVPELADAIKALGRAHGSTPAHSEEPGHRGDVRRIALQAAGRATVAATREPSIALNDIAVQERSIAIDIVSASKASETDHGAIRGPTEELLAALRLLPGTGGPWR